jgi:formate dehydrogenase major subunit
VPGLGTTFGRGGATTALPDLMNADAILIMGSNMAENHPVGFQWVMEARERGTRVIHVDPRFSRTSAVADLWAPLRAGSDVVFLGGLVNYVLENSKEFREYVVNYTNASVIIGEQFQDTEDLDGLFSGWDPKRRIYDPQSWAYASCGPKPDGDEHFAHGGHAKDSGLMTIQDVTPCEHDDTLQHLEAALCPLHAGDGRASMRHAKGPFPQNRRDILFGIGP